MKELIAPICQIVNNRRDYSLLIMLFAQLKDFLTNIRKRVVERVCRILYQFFFIDLSFYLLIS